METTTTTVICKFCKEEGHSVFECITLKEHPCTYCKGKGHTNFRCPQAPQNNPDVREMKLREKYGDSYKPLVIINGKHVRADVKPLTDQSKKHTPPPGFTLVKKHSKEKKEKKEKKVNKADSNSWAAKLAKTISREESTDNISNTIGVKVDTKTDEETERLKKWIEKYPMHMRTKHGEFWAFVVEGTQLDLKPAKERRTKAHGEDFESFLKGIYGNDWIFASEGSEYDCPYISTIRRKKEEELKEKELDDYMLWVTTGIGAGILPNDLKNMNVDSSILDDVDQLSI